jgi:hypothetical protein
MIENFNQATHKFDLPRAVLRLHAAELFAVASQVDASGESERHIARFWPAVKIAAGASSSLA